MAGGESVIPGRPSRPAFNRRTAFGLKERSEGLKIEAKDCDWSSSDCEYR